jgi:DNA-binding Lrp family transcriptional regulator
MKLKLDAIDRKILELLQRNSNITNAQLAQEVGLSPAPTLERVKKLETAGIIKSYHAVVDTASVGLGVSTFVMASLKGHNKENITKFISAISAMLLAAAERYRRQARTRRANITRPDVAAGVDDD